MANTNQSNTLGKFDEGIEKLNASTGGVGGNVVKGMVDAGKAASVDVVKGIVSAPMDILKGILGGGGDSGVEQVSGGPSSGQSTTDPQADNEAVPVELQKKIEADRKKVADRLKQHRTVLEQERQRYEESKQEVAEVEQEERMEKHEEEKKKIKQIEVRKKQESLAVVNAKQAGGTAETGKKKF